MNLTQHIDKNNLHHAYLIEGMREDVVPEILALMAGLGVEVVGNPDFVHISLDKFAVDDARNLKSFGSEKANSKGKKIFVISTNSFLLEAQNTLLKMFEEPIENTHFFLIVPDINALLQTFVSRFYLIKTKEEIPLKQAEEFIKMPLVKRIDFIRELILESEEEEAVILQGTRSKSLRFLNALEFALHEKKMSKMPFDAFQHIFKVREYLRMPGSSAKSLMESVALVVPKF